MMPPSQAATRYAPNRGRTATTSPAAISTMPTRYIAVCALPGTRSLNSGARYAGHVTSRSKNLSSPNAIGATMNPMRSSQNDWYAGSLRSRANSSLVDGALSPEWDRLVAMTCLLKDTETYVRPREVYRQVISILDFPEGWTGEQGFR